VCAEVCAPKRMITNHSCKRRERLELKDVPSGPNGFFPFQSGNKELLSMTLPSIGQDAVSSHA